MNCCFNSLDARYTRALEILREIMDRDHKDYGTNLYHCYCAEIWAEDTRLHGFDAPAPDDCLYCQAAALVKDTGSVFSDPRDSNLIDEAIKEQSDHA